MKIAAVGKAFPPHRYSQSEIRAVLEAVWHDRPEVVRRLATLHEHTTVAWRDLALPLDAYPGLRTFGAANDAYIRVATEIGALAVRDALHRAGLTPADVDMLLFASVTGVASPSIDARLVVPLGLRPDVRRMPLFGLGCVAGAAGLARAADFVRGAPRAVVVLLSVELCSLTFQPDDASLPHLISSGLFGDGAAAVVVGGADRELPGPQIVASRSVFYPDTEHVMGWKVSERGFEIVLSAAVPEIARTRLGPDADAFLASVGMTRADIDHWICHPGGPKVLRGMQESLGLDDDAVALAWDELANHGNLSSASVLMVLGRTLAERRPTPGTHGVLCAMGPGFCAEFVLIRF